MVLRAAFAAALFSGIALVPFAGGATQGTPDQQLVAGLKDATRASRAALSNLAKPTPSRLTRARADLLRALGALEKATKVSTRAVGAVETPSVRNGLRKAAALARQARADIAGGRLSAAKARIAAAMRLKEVALADFGVPLEKEFTSFAVRQDMTEVPGFSNFSGITATVGSSVSEIYIGIADRTTANAGEPFGNGTQSEEVAITRISQYAMVDPNGSFLGGLCLLDEGVIDCPFYEPMRSDQRFTIAFGPKLPKGTKVLVKFRGTNGDRSYALVSMR
jgi:hypothetical protein